MIAALLLTAGVAAGSGGWKSASALPSISPIWSVTLNDAGNPIALSSPVVANLPGGPAAVVGDRAGHVYAKYLSSGADVPGWPVSTGGIPVDSPPSVSGGLVYFGVGGAANPFVGGSWAVNGNGQVVWSRQEQDPPSNSSQPHGVMAGLSVGTLQGISAVVAPSLGQNEDAYNAANGSELAGFPWLTADTVFSTAALADIEGNGQQQIIEGGASTAGLADGQTYSNGGHIRILRPTGNLGFSQPNQGLYCEYDTNQDVISSPAVGQFLGGGAVGAVVGTGNDAPYLGGSDNHRVIAIDKNCSVRWSDLLDGDTSSSPALADVLGTGGLEVVEGTNEGNGQGSVWALNGSNGSVIWHAPAMAAVIGSVTTADLFGEGYQDVVVPTIAGVQILDGRTGNQVTVLESGVGVQSAPLITDDPNGSIGITVAGYNGHNQGVIEHFRVSGSNGSVVTEQGAWPEFHHDPQLTGNAGTPPPLVAIPCNPPAVPGGYYETAADGGLFSFGNVAFCGSTGNIQLNRPVIGMAATTDGGGYWLVASDGGIFGFGNARFFGSTGAIHLNAPIVGMAATPDDGGYWLVASDGGIFEFGDARFFGSTGAMHLNAPIVGMAPTRDGGGYWLVASDGGIFGFGDARFFGSTGAIHLNAPIVGMSATNDSGGYWLVASDGGIFEFGDAQFFGSTGGIHLNKPIVAMATDRLTGGYWLIASDGGAFSFNAPFYGSMGGTPLNQPIVAGAGV